MPRPLVIRRMDLVAEDGSGKRTAVFRWECTACGIEGSWFRDQATAERGARIHNEARHKAAVA